MATVVSVAMFLGVHWVFRGNISLVFITGGKIVCLQADLNCRLSDGILKSMSNPAAEDLRQERRNRFRSNSRLSAGNHNGMEIIEANFPDFLFRK